MNFIQSIIFLSLAGVYNEDNDPESTTTPGSIRYEFDSLHASPFWLLAILKPTTPIISIPLCITSSRSHLLAFLESTVPSFPPPLRTFFAIFFLSPVGCDTDFHLIDQGKVGYLYHLQILLIFNLQDSLSLLENNNGECNMNNTDEMTCGVMVIATSYNSSDDAISATIMTATMQAYPSSLYYDDNIHDTSCQSLYNGNDRGDDEYMYVFDATSSASAFTIKYNTAVPVITKILIICVAFLRYEDNNIICVAFLRY